MSANPITSTAAMPPLIPAATHRPEKDLPFVEIMKGVAVQVVHADIKLGIWVTRMKAQPGVTLTRHKHTGEVFAFTLAGSWKYLEYPEINTAGSYLYEPPGSIHTLHVLESNSGVTDVWFAIRGANLYLDASGTIESMADATGALQRYLDACRAAGHPIPDVITGVN
jgi:2,4'-dihydroxyacetophenone dioxygenase